MSTRTRKTSLTILIASLTMTCTYTAFAQTEGDATKTTTEAKPSKSEDYLKEIRDTLVLNIDKLPLYLNQITKMALSWLAPDDSTATATLQNQLATLANAKLENNQTHLESQESFINFFNPVPKPSVPDVAYQLRKKAADDVTYQTLLRPASPDTAYQNDSIFNYTLYASGLNIKHLQPEIYWRDNPSIKLYKNYYNTTSAVQTYNGYILSELYASSKNGNKIKQTQDQLVQQASSSDWFTQIASENMGVVLRQILLYNSQMYVMMTQLLDIQQKLLTAQTMNNALLIAVNQENESRLYNKAAGNRPE